MTGRGPRNKMQFSKPYRRVRKVFLHCSASDNPRLKGPALVDEITLWHRKNGWRTIGYHFVIDKEGRVMRGRDIELTPAAQAGHNEGSIAICVHGLAKSKFTDAALAAVLELCHQINDAYGGKVTFHGHREVAKKECPVFDYKALLNLTDDGHIAPVADRKEISK